VPSACGQHHVIDGCLQIAEERVQSLRIICVERDRALRIDLDRCSLETRGIARSQDDVRSTGMRPSGGFQTDARAASDDDDGLTEQFVFDVHEAASTPSR
jgi:hypothetical protein